MQNKWKALRLWSVVCYPAVITRVAEYGTYVPWKELEVITTRKMKLGIVMA
jgi:hypothetical protein